MAYHTILHKLLDQDFEYINDIGYSISNDNKKISIKYQNYFLVINNDEKNMSYFFYDSNNINENFYIYLKDLKSNVLIDKTNLVLETANIYLKENYHLNYFGNYLVFDRLNRNVAKHFMSYNSLYILKQYNYVENNNNEIILNYSTSNSSFSNNTFKFSPIKKITVNKNDGSYILEPNFLFKGNFKKEDKDINYLKSYFNEFYSNIDDFLVDIESFKDLLLLNNDIKLSMWYFNPDIEKEVIKDLLKININKSVSSEYIDYIRKSVIDSINNKEYFFDNSFDFVNQNINYDSLKDNIISFILKSHHFLEEHKINKLSISKDQLLTNKPKLF